MECLFFIFVFILIIGTIIASNTKKSPTGFRWNDDENQYARDRNISCENSSNDQKYWNALLVLDAAEHGIFWPGAESVFDELDEPQIESFDDISDEYYRSTYDDDNDDETNY